MNRLLPGVACFMLLSCSPGMAAHIVSCEPEWAQLSQEISGYKADVSTLVTKGQDPHHLTLTPNSVALVRQADLVVCNDIEHEPRLAALIRNSGNATLQRGQVGYLDVGQYIEAHGVQEQPGHTGWHHLQRDPRSMLVVAEVLNQRLAELDPGNSRHYRERYESFATEWKAAIRAWEKRAAPLNGIAVIEQRNSCEYLCRWLGIREIATVESTPGGSVNVGQMRKILAILSSHPARMIIAGPYHSAPAVTWLAEKTHLRVVTLPAAYGDMPGARGLYAVFDDAIDRMLAARS